MKPRIHVVWFNPTETPPGLDDARVSSAAAIDTFKIIEQTVAELFASMHCDAPSEFDEASSEQSLIEILDRLTMDDPAQARETLFWLLMPALDHGGRHYLGATGNSTSLLVPRLVTRYPLSWLVFNFRYSGELDRATKMIAPAYETAANGGCPTRNRRKLALEWHFFFGQPSAIELKGVVELFLRGLRQWFDPLGFRGAMLGCLKPGRLAQPSPGDRPKPRTVRESRRVFLAVAIDDEPAFAMCAAYAAYRAGMGAIAVSTARLFGAKDASPLAAIIAACASSPEYAPPDSVLILRDLDLQFADSEHDLNGESSLRDWPEPLWAMLETDLGIVVRAVTATAREMREVPPVGWEGVEKRLGRRSHASAASPCIGLSKPLPSVLLAPETGIRTIPFWRDLVGVMRGRSDPPQGPRSHHSPPRRLRNNIDFLTNLAARVGQSDRVEDLASAALLELVRLEATRGAGPMLVAEAVSQIYLLEARIEIRSPYFYAEPKLTARLRELSECFESVAEAGQAAIKTHLIHQILGQLKILYQSHGVFGATDKVQRELLKRPRWVGNLKQRLSMFMPAPPRLLRWAAYGILLAGQRLWGATLWAFFHPVACLLTWLSFDFAAYGVARLFFRGPDINKFAYLVITGNLAEGIHESLKTNSIVFVNIIFLAVFTTSLFRWVTRD